MILSDKAIELAIEQGKLKIEPLNQEQINRAHIDLHPDLPDSKK